MFLWKLIAWAAGALGFAAIITGGIWWIYTTGRAAGTASVKAEYETMIAKAQAEAKAELERRQLAYDSILELSNAAAAEFAREQRAMQERIAQYERALENNPDCRLSPDDLDALERLRP